MVNAGSVYVGTASFGDCPLVPGQLVQLATSNGTVQHTFTVMPQGCVGGAIWGSPTLDTSTNIIYIDTGNGDNCSGGNTYAYAVVALNAATLAPISRWQMPSFQRLLDTDFGSTPTLFTTTINGTNCGGSVSALNPATGAYIWRFCTSSPVLGAISMVPGMVIAAEGDHVWLLQASNGGKLAVFTDAHAGATFYGAPSIGDGRIYAGNMDGDLFAFGLY